MTQRLCWYCYRPLAGTKKALYWYTETETRWVHLGCRRRAYNIGSITGIEDKNVIHYLHEGAGG